MTETAAPEKTDQTPQAAASNGQPEQQQAPADPGPFVFNSIHEMIEQSPPWEGESVFKVSPRAWIGDGSKATLYKFVRAKNAKEAVDRAMDVSKVPHKDVYDAGMAFRRKQIDETSRP